MNKIVLFGVVVFIAVLGVILISNQSNSKTNFTPLSLSTSPAPTQFQTTPTATISSQPSTTPELTPATETPTPIAKPSTAVIQTSKGNITIKLYPDDAPNTVANFVKKAQTDYYKNLTFHRVEDWVVQGGDPKGNGTGGGNMDTELNKKTFVRGAVGVARGGDIKVSNDAQFFITKKDSQFLNGKYTNFGQVTAGMDVVDKIAIGDKILGITVE